MLSRQLPHEQCAAFERTDQGRTFLAEFLMCCRSTGGQANDQKYLKILLALHQVYSFLEPRLQRVESLVGAICLWELKTPWIVEDFQSLEVCVPYLPPDHTPKKWEIDSRAELVGCMYVLEGASLGGQVIVRKLRSSLGSQAAHALRFFEGYGAASYERWGLAACLKSPQDMHMSIQKPQAVFEIFMDSLPPITNCVHQADRPFPIAAGILLHNKKITHST